MAVTIPYTKQVWTDGSGGGTPVSAARLGVLEEGVFDVSYAPAVRAFHNANQSITTGTLTALALNSERFDQAGNAASTMHDTVTNNSRLTCRYAGIYDIKGNVQWGAGSTGFREVRVRVNGATYIAFEQRAASASSDNVQAIATTYSLAVNDYVELVVQHTQGTSINVLVSSNYSPEFMMVRVG